MFLQKEECTIRNATADDAALLASWWNDGKIMAHAGFPLGLGTTEKEIIKSLATDSDDTGRRLILLVGAQPVGEMNYRNKGMATAEIGIKICDATKQEKGLGTRFLSMLIAALFDDFGYEKVILDTNTNNTRAQHVYEKLGFTKVRVRDNSWKDQLGRLQSAVDYELTAENFHNLA